MLTKSAIDFLSQLGLSEKKISVIEKYLEFLWQRNQTMNLMSKSQDAERISIHHVVDSFLPYPFLKNLKQSLIIADVGTGAGFPGMLWAIAEPERVFVLIEKSPKKCQFLREVVLALGLENVTVINDRCESVSTPVDLIISRAMASTADILQQTQAMARQNTEWWLFKGLLESAVAEQKEISSTQWDVSLDMLINPLADVSRHLIRVKKKLI